MQHTFSLHKIEHNRLFGFSPEAYSRFKFGDDLVAQQYGTELAGYFIEHYLQHHPVTEQLVVISSPYSFIPTATFALKNYFVFAINQWLADNHFNVVQETKVHRTITYKEDYGALDAAQRMSLIGNDSFHIDRDFLVGKTLVFLDDIKITGSHERMIHKMLEAYQLGNDVHLLYFAELTNKKIHPAIENYLNYFAVKSIFDLDAIIRRDRFFMNTRIVKYILNTPESTFKVFIQNQDIHFTSLLYNLAIGNSYHTMDAYHANLQVLKLHIQQQKNLVVNAK